jgi:hypothetical protein
MMPWRQPGPWADIAAELRELRAQGLGRLLTEETVRFATVKALARHGVEPDAMRYEWPHPALRGSRIDLVVGTPPSVLIELKYPREPNETNAAWTMAYGEVLKDFYRLAAYPASADRVFVYAESARLHRYMTGAAARYGLDVNATEITLYPDHAARLPTTVASILGPDLATRPVTARRLAAIEVDATLSVHVYSVDPVADCNAATIRTETNTRTPDPVPTTLAPIPPQPNVVPPGVTPTGARGEILAAIDAITTRSGRATFELNDVLVEMRRRGSRYTESTVRTMVTSHMCANAPDHLAKTFDDLERVGRGLYRLRRLSRIE